MTTNSLRGIASRQSNSRGRTSLSSHLRKKISQAENQLAQPAIIEPIKEPSLATSLQTVLDDEELDVAETENILTESVETNEQPEVPKIKITMSETRIGNKNMIAPGTRDAPRFSAKKPEELRRFLRQMEDLWADAGIQDAEKKKESLGKYADYESEEEWAAFTSYGSGYTWDKFKTELFENYPEAAEAHRGTPQRLRQICEETREIHLGDLQSLVAFRRRFMTEAKKLLKPPAVMSNRELVELFIGRLASGMGALVLQHLAHGGEGLSQKGEKEEGTVEEPSKLVRRPEDRFDLENVWKAAVSVSENYRGIFFWTNKPEEQGAREILALSIPAREERMVNAETLSRRLQELENAKAAETDAFLNMAKNIDTKISALVEDKMKAMLALTQSPEKSTSKQSGASFENSPNGFLGKPGSMPKWNRSAENDKCFYCGIKGHFVPECEELKAEVRAGNVKVHTDGKLRMSDGVTRIPSGPPGMTIKERLERSQNNNVKSAYYEGFYENEDGVYIPSMAKYAAQYTVTNESQEKRRQRLEQELELREREDALELRKIKLEKEEQRLEASTKAGRHANVQSLLDQLTDEEIAAIKAAKVDFR